MNVKLLVEDSAGRQDLIEIHITGRETARTVLWDERKDGIFPTEHENQIGGLSRGPGKTLVFDQAKFDAHDAVRQAEAAALADAENEDRNAKEGLRTLVRDWGSLTAAQQRQALRHLIRLVIRE
jgi:hypothetical protein